MTEEATPISARGRVSKLEMYCHGPATSMLDILMQNAGGLAQPINSSILIVHPTKEEQSLVIVPFND